MAEKHKILKKLDEYLSNATPEQLAADWKELEKYNKDGPEMLDCLARAEEQSVGTIDWKCKPISSPDTYRFQLDLYKKLINKSQNNEDE